MILLATILFAVAPVATHPAPSPNQDPLLGKKNISSIGHELPYVVLASTIDGVSRTTTVEDPMFATNMANRLWKQMFGLGLVEPVDGLKGHR